MPAEDFEENFRNCAVFCFSESWIGGNIETLPGSFSRYTLFDHPETKDKIHGRSRGGLGIMIDEARVKHPLIRDDTFIIL